MVVSFEARTDRDPKENGEDLPLKGRTVLVVGGATGSGFDLVQSFHELGGTVIPTSRTNKNLDKNVIPAIGTNRVIPMVLDITKTGEVDLSLSTLKERGVQITDCIISAAGGMESFSVKMGLALARIIKKAPKERPAAIQKLLEDIRGWVDESREAAMAVNYHGPRHLLHRLTNHLPPGAIVAYYSSWWSSLYRSGIQVPPFYDAVAASKYLFERELTSKASDLRTRGIHTAIITGNLLIDSPAGQLFNKFLIPMLPESERAKLKSFPTMSDMTAATVSLFRSDPTTWPEVPLYKWVAGSGVILDSIPADEGILKVNFFP